MAADPKHFYEFGPFRIDVSERTLSRDGQIVAITPKVFDLLLMLVRNSGETVDKETLMREVWPDSFVEESNLPVNMTALRRALGESPDEHTYIETVPRRGYRFVAEVTENWDHDRGPDAKPRPGMRAMAGLRLASVETTVAPALTVAARKRVVLPLSLAAVVIAGAVVLAVYYRGRPVSRPSAVRATIPAPENALLGSVAVSPDGLRLAFSVESHGKQSLWLRPLRADSGQPLSGTEGAFYPFWSPDSRFIGFFASGKLKKIEVSDGAIQTLCDLPILRKPGVDDFLAGAEPQDKAEDRALSPQQILGQREHIKRIQTAGGKLIAIIGAGVGRGGTWSRDGVIVFALDNGPLYRVSESGGEPFPLRLDNEPNELTYHRYPCFLPDGRHFIYRAGATYAYSRDERNGIYAGSLESNESKLILRADTRAFYASGHLLFWREKALIAQPFDEKSLQLTGDAVSIAEPLYFDPRNVEAEFSVTENGFLVFVSGPPGVGQLVWLDRNGKQVGRLGEPGLVCNPRISPDGKRVAAQILDPSVGTTDIWVYDVARNAKTRFTFDPAFATRPVWSPDGSRIAFSSNRKNGWANIYVKDSSGLGNEEVLFESDEGTVPVSWSSDGRFIAYVRDPPAPHKEVWLLPFIGERKPLPFLQAQFYQGEPQFSPDVRFIAYESYESGSQQIYVRPFRGPGGKQQVSTDSGWNPHWRRDSKELFFLDEGEMMAADVKSNGSSLDIGDARFLFDAHPWWWAGQVYDVTPDGQRFLMVTASEGTPATINLIVNWTADLKRN
jgi:DNA-binding winged helix-turn-helix (wHTH) protein/Tol biopolymer transport system component